ncbi:hypothetical protein Baya_1926 [Bagarius yarrelli]|uniref:Uncharacterized protein n=1 Tax=Bagarius yarrelli TaxID=175774 RepID=A0A556TMH4_BAGYA|nr:hypothetical protein Baya_1926 [Bagarius yarrelli]
MDELDGFESQLSSVMQNALRTAVGEASKVFQQTLRQMKAELVHLRQENVDLKSGVYTPPYNKNKDEDGDGVLGVSHNTRDVGVQCEKPTMVERCCSPAPIDDRPNLGPNLRGDHLKDFTSSSSEGGNRQLALLLIKKEEADCDEYGPGYFLLKQEGAEPILVRKEPFKNSMEKDLLQPLPPISFPSPNQQETSSIIRSQTSGQILQLAPLLTLKEQQAAASSHVNMSKRGSRMHVENPMSTVNNFEEHVHQYPPFSSHGSNCANESITMEMQSDDLIGNNKDIRPSLNPGPIQHYTVLSKPGINFRVLESTKEQQSFRMNMVKDLQIDNDINKQKEGCDKACQGWDVSNMNGVLPQISYAPGRIDEEEVNT